CGRADDMLVIRGINVFPSDIEGVLLGIPDLAPQYRIVVDREHALDTVEVQVEARVSGDGERLTERVGLLMRNMLGIAVDVTVLEPHAIPRSEGKALRVVDRRKL
ncbi:MAG TPA: phenylacetate--CoA ligase, partial [Candidatus Limnocylindria bacterium]